MGILGISASGRRNRIIHQTVEAIASQIGGEYEVVSLAGKRMNGCIGCTMCASDNICKVKDDWNEIGEKMTRAEVIIFGAPNYYGTINALGHACLERTFSFRHREVFSLQNKVGISVSTTRATDAPDPVKEIIQYFMESNRMRVLGHVSAAGYDQCYTCGFGHGCSVGNVVRHHGVLECIKEEHLPADFKEQSRTLSQIEEILKLYRFSVGG
jgi:multimeric flavodoxin WrbA